MYTVGSLGTSHLGPTARLGLLRHCSGCWASCLETTEQNYTGFPGGPDMRTARFHCRGTVQSSLAQGARSHMLQGVAKKIKIETSMLQKREREQNYSQRAQTQLSVPFLTRGMLLLVVHSCFPPVLIRSSLLPVSP